MSVVILLGVLETVLGAPTVQLIDSQMKLRGAKILPREVGVSSRFYKRTNSIDLFRYFVFWAWNKGDSF